MFIILHTKGLCNKIVAKFNKIISWVVQGQYKWAVVVLKFEAVVSDGYNTAVARASLALYATDMTPMTEHRRRALAALTG